MNIVLVGYRGSGKSTVGALLAQRFNWPFIDVDELIVRQSGRTIAEIFSKEGEAGFRRLELQACLSVQHLDGRIIALGGGALTQPEIRTLMKRLGKVVWLRAPAAVLWARISRDSKSADSRPDLSLAGGLDEVEAVLEQRESLYRKAASHTLDTLAVTPEEIAEAIVLWYEADDSTRSK